MSILPSLAQNEPITIYQARTAKVRRSLIVGAGLHVAGEGYEPDSPIATVIDTFRNWLHFPDPAPVLAAMGVVAGHLLPGSPVWLMLVGQASCGKTEVINSLGGLDHVFGATTLNEAALLSGSSKRDRDSKSTGGLLRMMGNAGILSLKDFTSILRMKQDDRDECIGALSEIYDGYYVRNIGADGGRTMEWRGKMSLITGCTPIIDNYHSIMVPMGSRFMFYRFDLVNGYAQADKALSSSQLMVRAREDIQRSVIQLFESTVIPESMPALEGESRKRLIALTNFAIKCRSYVEREKFKHEIVGLVDPEGPGRVITSLQQLFNGMRVIGIKEEEAWRVTCRVAMDSMPALRLRLVQALSTHKKDGLSYGTGEMAEHLQYPIAPVRRGLEDLEALRMVERDMSGKEHMWKMTPGSLYEYRNAFPKGPGV